MIEKSEARRIQAEIRNIFMDVWDPIGVKDLGAPRDEYDSYIGPIYGLLSMGASDEEIVAELLRIEQEQMGLSPPVSTYAGYVSKTVAALRALKLPESSK